jgi:hypothetical protein
MNFHQHRNFNRVGNAGAIGRTLSVAVLLTLFLFALPISVNAGTQDFTSSGSFVVPEYNTLTIWLKGPGGGGGGDGAFGGMSWYPGGPGGVGAASTVSALSLVANSGGGGGGGYYISSTGDYGTAGTTVYGGGGSSGSASGGDTNTTGGGSAGGAYGDHPSYPGHGGSGGYGGYVLKTFTYGAPGAPVPGDILSIVIGGGGAGGAKGGLSGYDYGRPGSPGTAGSGNATWTDPAAPSVTTSAASSVTSSGAILNGSITATNGSDATQHGFAYSTNSTLSTGVSTTTLGSKTGTGAFSEGISSLTSSVTYYVRAYATNSTGTGYGSIQSFTTTAPTITITKNTTVTGDAVVIGTISKGSGTFVIDHPLDPKNKLLYHSFVESPDVLNIYDGIATLDKNGEATIELPKYFLALNKDFTYLGTAIGEPMPNLFLSKGVRRWFFGLFGRPVIKISGGVPGGRVSWQVTGIRKDPFILAHPIIPEVDKGPDQPADKGEFICPECYVK